MNKSESAGHQPTTPVGGGDTKSTGPDESRSQSGGSRFERVQAIREDDPDLLAANRTLALIDQVIGLQAELAEETYRHDREAEGYAAREWELRQSLDEANKAATEATAQLEEVFASRSWRLGQLVIKPLHRIGERFKGLR